MGTEINAVSQTLDSLRRTTTNGIEHWMARDILQILGYVSWDNFTAVIDKAKMACESSGRDPSNHFHDVMKEITAGKGAISERADCVLSRYACYLIAMNGDPRKSEIAGAQTYFAIQTRRRELDEQQSAFDKRLELRQRVTIANKALGTAAKNAGVRKYGLFQDAGYRGLYGMGLNDIKRRKKIDDNLLDHAGRAELAANEFRITQTEQKLVNEKVDGEQRAINTHQTVASEVRATIKKLGGTMPEDLPAEPSLKKLTSQRKKELRKPDQPNEP